ncbi:unnamed protein product [Adineta ricciae]|nr:unnamed protein product [Adineta ricciae]
MFTLNVCLAIIVCALYWMIYYIMLEFNPLKLFSVNTCGFLSYAQVLCTFQVSLAFTVVSIHRLCLIAYPTKLFFKTKRWATICVLSQWCVGVVLSLPILIDQSSCTTVKWKRIYTLILVVIIPSLSHVIINSIIVKYVRASSLRVRPEIRATQISMINPTNQNQPRAQHQTKISRRDVHLLRHMIFMFFIFVGGWMPIYVMTVVMACAIGAASISENIHRQKRDNFGCDAFVTSCGSKGACCDVHDQCYKEHGCTWASWLYTDSLVASIEQSILSMEASKLLAEKFNLASAAVIADSLQQAKKIRDQMVACRQCNNDAMSCVVNLNPGPSTCCTAKTCGQPRTN